MSREHPLPSNPMSGRSPSPAKDDRPGFSRSGFAPIPHRHQDFAPPPPIPSGIPPSRDDELRRDSMSKREPMERWDPRDDYDRRPPWEDHDRKRRRSSSPPPHPSRRMRRSPSPPRHGLPDPADIDTLLSFKQFADWFRASHPQTARADEEEVRRAVESAEGLGKEKKGMAKRYERYRKEYTSRQLYALYLTHRESPWFVERYSPDQIYATQRRRVNRQGRVPTAEKYLDALKAGEYDSVNFDLEPGLSGDDLRLEIPPSERQVFVKTVPPSTSRKELEDLFGKVEGFQYLALTEPFMKKQFHRVAWAQFADGVDPQDVVNKLDGSKIDTFTFHMGVNASPVIGRTRITAPAANTLERLVIDGEKAHDLAYKLEEELIDEDTTYPGLREKGTTVVQNKIDQLLEDQGLVGDDLADDMKLKRAKLIADHWISYLRHGLSTCYYCVAPSAFQEELHRKCVSHKRPDSNADVEDGKEDDHEEDEEERHDRRQSKESERWEETLDKKLRPLLQQVDVQEYGGRDPEEETRKLAAPLIKQEEASKYRCKECNKLFRAPEFVVKHITVKHLDLVDVKTDELAMLNAFVLDPQRIQPTAQTPAAVNDRLPLPPQPQFNGGGGGNGGGMNMMQQQMMMMMQMQQAMMMGMGRQGQGLAQRMGGFAEPITPLPTVPPGAEDPRAKRGRVSYQDLDAPGGGGDGGLPY
ncbi:hypothetical protein BD324DRAFT_633296 [Kockovaella imperatae]|uniref:C2H2-type domain-containing protein n=1 Tax=Kockovaella imperatae TaxID=4999 RepID=A0A1Y1UCZ1_9TREE|nr:hypothetical protein BD324DRAFT_633296 [Kockovaella imperatae]ORX34935.1 hypothetical protein BD324DRAFT_633296 [Kockovaella imperatae]